MKLRTGAAFAASIALAAAAGAVEPPAPHGPVPSARQLAWHELEVYGFVHFTVNTFTDKEWGYGDEAESVFAPTAFDADQIASAFKAGGLKGLILTCKHHDGFCLWPSKFTEHSVKNSPWKDGKGDMVREFADACRRAGLKFGTYLSPWDRNHKDYATPAYVDYYRNQLRELLTNYGEIFEVWFDGANGGDGYYGGAREKRKIDNRTYYGWETTWALVRELQPGAMMFSDGGPDVRWVGNEKGIAGDPCYATVNRDDFYPGTADRKRLNHGDRPGTHWVPAECDVSIRPGWFYHAAEDAKVRTPENLVDLYFQSVGRGASFLLNIPPDRRGLVHENDLASLRGFRERIDALFATNLAKGATATASNTRGGDMRFAPGAALDTKPETWWCTDDAVRTAEIVVDLIRPASFNVVSLREPVAIGQRIDDWALDAWRDGQWVEFAKGTAIGARRLWRGAEDVTTDRVRLRILSAAACPALSEFALHREPDAHRPAKAAAP
jgi:alpha-L-fucosidase